MDLHMNRQNPIIKGTLILTITGLLTRVIGFYYRIFLSNQIGASQLGIYQMVFPLLVLAFALTSSGIELVISRQVAASTVTQNSCKAGNRRQILHVGLLLSLFLSIPVAFLIHHFAAPLATRFLGDVRCASLLRIGAMAIPLSGIHMCVEGYYQGHRKSGIPATACLLEQLVRVFSVWLLCKIAHFEGKSLTVEIAMYGLVLGEAAAALTSLTALSFESHVRLSSYTKDCTKTILRSFTKQGIPLTANRVLLNTLQSLEALLIPLKLKDFGLSHTQSLGLYGILTGMAMPFIMFPSTLTNSISAMLLPTVATAQANHKKDTLSKTASYTLQFCLVLGIFCTGIFIAFGRQIGLAIFHNETAGKMLQTLGWICPLLYISNTFASMIHGLGKTSMVFLINLLSLSLRILVVLLLIPKYSLSGYLWGILFCYLLSTVLYYLTLRKHISFSLPAVTYILKPCLTIAALSLPGSFFLRQKPVSIGSLILTLLLCGLLYLGVLFCLGCFKKQSSDHG